MANALQDQLLKAGLVNDKQLKKAQKEKRQEVRQTAGRKGGISDDAQSAQKRAIEKAERDRKLNRQHKEALEQKAVAAQIKQLVDAHRVATGDGEVAYQFADEGKVKSLYVTEAVRRQIVRGRLAIVKSEGRYELVPADTAEKIRIRSAARVLLWNSPEPAEDAGDEYAAYTVPDDLIW